MTALTIGRSARSLGRTKLQGMKLIRGGEFLMGCESFYDDEGPVRSVTVGDFWIDETPVTNADFETFVRETGYVTFAETAPDPFVYIDMDPALAQPGSLVFMGASHPVDLKGPPVWWDFIIGANWRHPLGPGSSTVGIESHPVVHVVHADAQAYASWAGKALPTEAEWEYACRGGLVGKDFAWGDELMPDGQVLANFWLGQFPYENLAPETQRRTSEVKSFPPNPFGLYDMIGNVWEWTDDWYVKAPLSSEPTCCGKARPRAPRAEDSIDPREAIAIPRKVAKGGSHLCAPNHCQRYRPGARWPQPIDTSTSHMGFRCVARR